jgi:hypothetical protein
MTVDSRPTTPTTTPTRGAYRAPLSREELERSIPWLRALGGVLLLSYSSITTIHGVGVDFAPFFQGQPLLPIIGISPQQLLSGLLLALLISLVQWLTSEKLPLIYALFLLVDARWTQWSIAPIAERLLAYHLPQLSALWVTGLTFVVSWTLAVMVARYGEVLLLGRRR